MKFKPHDREARVDWLDGAVLILRYGGDKLKNDIRLIAQENGITDPQTIGEMYAERIIVGWENIEDENTGKPLEYNDHNRAAIYYCLKNPELENDVAIKALDAYSTFLRGPLGNLKAGLTSTLNTDGTNPTAPIASKEKSKDPVK
jgi:hypothetical protein